MCCVLSALKNKTEHAVYEFKSTDNNTKHGPDLEVLANVNGFIFKFEQFVLLLCYLLIIIKIACVLIGVPPCVPCKAAKASAKC
jgi:hypothetical protein